MTQIEDIRQEPNVIDDLEQEVETDEAIVEEVGSLGILLILDVGLTQDTALLTILETTPLTESVIDQDLLVKEVYQDLENPQEGFQSYNNRYFIKHLFLIKYFYRNGLSDNRSMSRSPSPV